MSWIQQNAFSYIHSSAPFSLQSIGGTWYLIDNRDQSKAIPFDDIFNNPVFPVDLSNADVLVKSLSATNTVSGTHIRGEGANTPSTPAHSFKNEISSGMYRISAGKVGFSLLGNRVGEFGSDYGGFTGNVIQVVQTVINGGTAVTTSTSFQDYTALERTITPRYSNSKILIQLSGSIFYAGAFNFYGGEIGIFSSQTSSRVIFSDYQVDGRTNKLDQSNIPLSITFLDSPATTSTITYTPQYRSIQGYTFGFGWATNSYHSLTLMEIQQ